jgi:hypothetical protein
MDDLFKKWCTALSPALFSRYGYGIHFIQKKRAGELKAVHNFLESEPG